ncbi:sensor histidine kinase [Magnetospirillum aberrantis]|uniref:histidine kinase n=1 Tax=Magnetospirillum aberrantis SpK TaxID=908842 RepID=A0A7C9USK7_9PROT|nr:HAMP domain-containing sensor histidine kinase [Magnetospirillum aberrantis]NFV79388.1 HAMP domain-containing histidine kinase [Magnetospirillum aberrantis SpK]
MADPVPASLRRRLILAALLWLVLALAASGAVLRVAFEDSIERTFQLRLMTAVRALAAVLEENPDGGLKLARPVGDPRFEQPLAGWYWQVADRNGVVLRSRSLWDATLPVSVDPAAEPGSAVFGRVTGPRGESLLTAERELSLPEREHPVHVMVAADRHDVDRELRSFDRLLAVSFVLLGAGLVVAMTVQVGYGLKPLKRLTHELETLRRRAGGRLSGGYPAEIAPLAQAMNAVLDHDAELVERARTHVGNLAHGLKTPLSVMRAELSAPGADHAVLAEQVDRMARMVEHHLTRARTEASSARALGAKVPVAPVIDEISGVLKHLHRHRPLILENHCAADAVFAGDRDDLAEMVGNLMDNACKWAKTRVRVTTLDSTGLVLSVEDDGPGLPEADYAKAKRRGTRLDENAPGHGLGLDIVRDLSELYGGHLELDRSPLGGLMARLIFPPSPNAVVQIPKNHPQIR